jgi:hypothetical protein
MGFILLILVILLCLGGLPQISGGWHNYGYYPVGLGTILVVVVIILLVSGRL